MADDRLGQVMFLRTLAQDFDRFGEMYDKARPILAEYQKVPRKMETEWEWGGVVDALRECYRSVMFLYRVALLVKSGVIDKDLLYVFYYEEFADNLTFKLSPLVKWCGTGLDLAANYSADDLARVAGTLVALVEDLDIIHQENGADLQVEGHTVFLDSFKENTKDFFANPKAFRVDSPDYVDRFVAVRHERRKRGS